MLCVLLCGVYPLVTYAVEISSVDFPFGILCMVCVVIMSEENLLLDYEQRV